MLVRVEGGPLDNVDLRVSQGDARAPGKYVWQPYALPVLAPARSIQDCNALPEAGWPPQEIPNE